MDFNIQFLSWDDEKRTKRARLIAKEIAHTVDLKKSHNAMEFGCGTGLISFNLYDQLKNITCIDTSQGMIHTLHSKIQQSNITTMTAYQLDINDGHLLMPTYDLIYTSMALHHVMDIEKTLKNLYSLLNKNGSICIVDLDEEDGSFHKAEKDFHGYNGFNQNELKNSIKNIGFEEVDSHTFYRDQKVIEDVSINYSLFIMTGKK